MQAYVHGREVCAGRRGGPLAPPRRFEWLHARTVVEQSSNVLAARITTYPHSLEEHVFYTADVNGRVKIGRVGADGEPSSIVAAVQLHHNAIFDVLNVEKDGVPTSCMLTASADCTCGVFDLEGGLNRIATLRGHTGSVKNIAQQPGSLSNFASAGRDGRVLQWDVRQQQPVARPGEAAPHGRDSPRAHESTDVPYLVGRSSLENAHSAAPIIVGAQAQAVGRLARWTTAAGRPTRNETRATGGADASGSLVGPARGRAPSPPAVTCVEFLDALRLTTAGADGTVRIWDARCGVGSVQLRRGAKSVGDGKAKPLHTLEPTGRGINSMSVSADGNRLLAGTVDSTCSVYTLASPEAAPVRLRGHVSVSFWQRGAKLSPDGRHVAAGGEDGQLYLWQVDRPHSPPLVLRCEPPAQGGAELADEINCLEWARRSGSGDWLVTGSDRGLVRVWSVQPDHGYAPQALAAMPHMPPSPTWRPEPSPRAVNVHTPSASSS